MSLLLRLVTASTSFARRPETAARNFSMRYPVLPGSSNVQAHPCALRRNEQGRLIETQGRAVLKGDDEVIRHRICVMSLTYDPG